MSIKKSTSFSNVGESYNLHLRVIDCQSKQELERIELYKEEHMANTIESILNRYEVALSEPVAQAIIKLGYWVKPGCYEFVLEHTATPSTDSLSDCYYLVMTNRRKNAIVEEYCIGSHANIETKITEVISRIYYIWCRDDEVKTNNVVDGLLTNGIFDFSYFSILLLNREEYDLFTSNTLRRETNGFVQLTVKHKLSPLDVKAEYIIPVNDDIFTLVMAYLNGLSINVTKANLITLYKTGSLSTGTHTLEFNLFDISAHHKSNTISSELEGLASNEKNINNLYDFLANKDIRQLSRIYTAIVFDNDSSDKTDLIKEVKSLVDDGIIDRPYGGLVNGIKETIAMIMAEYIGG